MTEDRVRYPVGNFEFGHALTPEQRVECIEHIAQMPARAKSVVSGLNATQMNTPYRDGGWTCAQVIHHLVDSHVNAYTRFKLALTEDVPTIKTYDEKTWVELGDAKTLPVDASLALLEALHLRIVAVLRNLKADDFSQRKIFHPEANKALTLDELLGLYAWHSRHHVAQIQGLRDRSGWN